MSWKAASISIYSVTPSARARLRSRAVSSAPSQALFAKAPRAFSSGCVRVEAISELATLLLAPDELAQVETLLASGKTRDYRLRQPVPLLMAYWTVEVDAQGQPRYLPDIYQRDDALAVALDRAAP